MRRNIGKGTGNLYFSDVYNAKHLSVGYFPPRLKFNGFAEFYINPDLKAKAIEIGIPKMRNDLAGFTREASLPKLQFKTEVMNQYNIKRVVQTGVELQPVTMEMYDTVTNDWYEMLMTYYAYSYMNPRQTGKNGSIQGQNAIPTGSETWTRESTFMSDKFPSNASGFDANDTPHLFDAIRLVVVNGQQGREIMLHRPIITSIAFGDIEHSANEVNTFQVEFDYENFTVGKVIEKPLDEIDLAKFSIYGGTDSGTYGIAKNERYDPLDAEAPYRQKVGQEMPAAGLLDAGRRSQPQPQQKISNKLNDPNQQRDKLGGSI